MRVWDEAMEFAGEVKIALGLITVGGADNCMVRGRELTTMFNFSEKLYTRYMRLKINVISFY